MNIQKKFSELTVSELMKMIDNADSELSNCIILMEQKLAAIISIRVSLKLGESGDIDELSFLKHDGKWCLAIIRDGVVQVLRSASRLDRIQVFIDGSVVRLVESIPQQLRDALLLREQAQEVHAHVNRLLEDLGV